MAIYNFPREGGGEPRGPSGGDTEPTPLPSGWISSKKYGSPIPLVFGRAAVPGVPVWRGTYISGGGYVWDGANWLHKSLLAQHVVLALCEAPVDEVVGCFKRYGGGLKLIAPANYVGRITLDGGAADVVSAATATAWSVYGGTYAEGISHSGTCHARLTAMILDEGGVIPDTRWIVQSSECVNADSGQDAHPALLLEYLLTNATHGLGYSTSMVDVIYGTDGNEASGYRRYCNAMAFYVSRAITEGEAISDVIEDLLYATNSTLIWVDGKLKAVPLSDEAVTRASFTYTPVTATYQIGNVDFVPGGDDPVSIKRRTRSSVASVYPVKYLCRSSITDDQVDVGEEQYVSDIWIAENGIRKAETIDLSKWIASPGQAFWVSYATSQRSIYHRTTYTFRLGPRWAYLAPGDFVAITDSTLGLSAAQARIQTIEEDPDGVLTVEALEWPLGTTSNAPTAMTARAGDDAPAGARFFADYNLANVPARSVTTTHGTLQNPDNLIPNPTSEDTEVPATSIEAAGVSTDTPYAGARCRKFTALTNGYLTDYIPCIPGDKFYFECQAKCTGTVGHLYFEFTDAAHENANTDTEIALSSLSSYTLESATVTVPAGTVWLRIWAVTGTGTTIWLDALYLRRVIQPEMVASQAITLTNSSGWSYGGNIRKTGSMITGLISSAAQGSGGPAFSSVLTFPAGSRPLTGMYFSGIVQSSGTLYPAIFLIGTDGVLSMPNYDNGATYATPYSPIVAADAVILSFNFAWQ